EPGDDTALFHGLHEPELGLGSPFAAGRGQDVNKHAGSPLFGKIGKPKLSAELIDDRGRRRARRRIACGVQSGVVTCITGHALARRSVEHRRSARIRNRTSGYTAVRADRDAHTDASLGLVADRASRVVLLDPPGPTGLVVRSG